MNPHQKNKVDISSLNPDEQKLFRLYGKLPNQKDMLQNKMKERKYFDSGDYALSKAGKPTDIGVTAIGHEHPNPENIPHLSTSPVLHTTSSGSSSSGSDSRNGSIADSSGIVGPRSGSISGGRSGSVIGLPAPGGGPGGPSGSPVKEPSFLNREQSIDDQPGENGEDASEGNVSPPVQREGLPIRVQH